MHDFDIGSIIINLLIVIVLVAMNGFFVAAEFALVKVRATRLIQRANEGNKRAKYALRVNNKLDAYLSATQLGITLASLGLGWVGEPAVSHLIMEPLMYKLGVTDETIIRSVSVIIGFIIITFMHIVLGELAPKSLAIQKSEGVSLWLSGPLLLFHKVFFPAIALLNGTANRLLRLIGIQPASENETAHTEEELRLIVGQSAKSGIIDKDEKKLFDNIFEFSDRLAREVMLPRTDMDCLYTTHSFADNMNIVYTTKHTRYPVGIEDKDGIIGFIHITDLLIDNSSRERDLTEIVRPILNVPESMEISQVLKLMQTRHSQLAIVVDEYGGTAGMLTIELILEELVGEIHDEFDSEQPSIVVKDGVTTVEGRALIDDINQLFNLNIKHEDVDTIGGWMFTALEGNPVRGKKLEHEDYIFEVAECQRLRVLRVKIYPKPEQIDEQRSSNDAREDVEQTSDCNEED